MPQYIVKQYRITGLDHQLPCPGTPALICSICWNSVNDVMVKACSKPCGSLGKPARWLPGMTVKAPTVSGPRQSERS